MRVISVANTAEIIAIMRHAAQRLSEEDAQRILPANVGSFSDANACRKRAASADTAMAYAGVVLRMVAAIMEEDAPRSECRNCLHDPPCAQLYSEAKAVTAPSSSEADQ